MEKKECRSCMCLRVLELFSGKNLTCDKCLEKSKRYRDRHPERMRESWKRYYDEHREEVIEKKKEYMKEYNRRNVECKICGCEVRKIHWARHERTRKHRMGISNGNLVGTGVGG